MMETAENFIKYLFNKSRENGFLKIRKYPHLKTYTIKITPKLYKKLFNLLIFEKEVLTIENNKILFFYQKRISEIVKLNDYQYKVTIWKNINQK